MTASRPLNHLLFAVALACACLPTLCGADVPNGWSGQASGAGVPLRAVHFLDAQLGWAVGDGGTILHTSDGGATWTAQTSGMAGVLYGIHSELSRAWAVGDAGTILVTTDNGANWTPQNSGTTAALIDVCFADANKGWAVGTGGTILHTGNGGVNWAPQNSGTAQYLASVEFENATFGCAVGYGGTILRTTDGGATWTSQGFGAGLTLEGVSLSGVKGWAVGSGGTILHTADAGANWVPQTAGPVPKLYAVHFDSATRGWAVGASGTIIRTLDGGASWTSQISGTTEFLFGAWSFAASKVWAVGGGGTILHTATGGGFPEVNVNDGPMVSDTDIADGGAAATFGTVNAETGSAERTFNIDNAAGTGDLTVTSVSVTGGNASDFTVGGIALPTTVAVGSSTTFTVTFDPSDTGTRTTTLQIVNNDDDEATYDITLNGTGGPSLGEWSFSNYGGTLRSVHFADGNNGWAVGNGGVVFHTSDGGANWSPQASNSSTILTGVHFLDAMEGWVVGQQGVILHTTDGGANWAQQASGVSAHLAGVHFADAMNGWVVGASGVILATSDGGANWTQQTSGVSAYLYAVHFVDATEGWVVGQSGVILHTTNGGANWSAQTSGTTQNLPRVHFADDMKGWAVGQAGLILHTADGGANWNQQTSGVTGYFQDVYFADGMKGWAVGQAGLILHTTDGGANWSQQTSSIGGYSFYDVHFSDAGNGWVVGDPGTIFRTTDGGGSWTKQTSGTTRYLRGVQFFDTSKGWVVGEAGTILNTTDGGTNWSLQTVAAGYLNDVHFIDATTGWTVAQYGRIFHTTDGGVNWPQQTSGTGDSLYGVHFSDATKGWTVGQSGTVLHTTDGGANWSPQNSGVTGYLQGVYFSDGMEGWAVGQYGTILHTTDGGANWVQQTSGVTGWLRDVYFVDSMNGWVVGEHGVILYTADGGANWSPQTSYTGTNLFGLHVADAMNGWAVGVAGTILKLSVSEINVTGNGQTITDGDTTPSTADGTDSGAVVMSSGPVVRTFTIENVGTATLDLGADAVSVSGTHASDFAVTSQPATTVAAGGTTTFTVTFDPSAPGLRTASLSIANDDDDEAPYDFDIQGNGVTMGDLDPTFGGGTGKVTTAIGGGDEQGHGIAVQGDGKILVAGYSHNSANYDFALARYNADGSLDTTFNSTGTVTTAIGSGDDYAYGVAVQGDGKIVVVGYSSNSGIPDFAVVRYNADGSLDETFNGTGIVTTDFGGRHDFAYGVAIQSDGKIVVAGNSSNGSNSDFALARYNTNGSLDESFSSDGWVITAIGASHDFLYDIALQSDGKILAAGAYYSGVDWDFALMRYDTDGSLDTSFSSDGIVTTSVVGGADVGYNVAVQSDGRILVAGQAHNGSNKDFAVVRYNVNGSLDSSFSSDGIVRTAVGGGNDAAQSVTVQSDGRILVAGQSNNGSDEDFALVRYHSDGSLDTSFHSTGIATVDFNGGEDVGKKVAIQSDRNILVAGWSHSGSNHDFALARFVGVDPEITVTGNSQTIADGDITPDAADHTDFGGAAASGGTVVRTFTIENVGGLDLTVSSIVVSGADSGDFALGSLTPASPISAGNSATFTVTFDPSATGTRTATITVNSNDSDEGVYDFATQGTGLGPGNLDPGFGGGDGKVTTAFGSGDDHGDGVAVQADGKVLVAGYAHNGGNYDFALARYLADGSTLDTSFGSGGKTTTAMVGGGSDVGTDVVVQPDGKILVAGYADNGGNNDFALARYNTDGSLDTGFGSGGKVLTDFSGGHDESYGLALQPDGKIVAAGQSHNGANYDFAVARYNADGSLDTGFGGGDGRVTIPFGSGHDESGTVALQSDGRIVMAGRSHNGTDYDFALARVESDGTLDTTFDTDGKVTTPIGSSDDYGQDVAVQDDGRILVSGGMYNGADVDFVLVRYHSNGSLDTAFGSGGKVITPIGASDERGNAVALQFNGKIVVAGYTVLNNHDFALARYNRDGSLDTTFGSAGLVTTAIGGGIDVGNSLALQSDNSILVAGYSHNGGNYDFALARYVGDPPAPEITVTGNSQVIADGDTTPDAADHTDVGGAAASGGAVVRTFTIENVGGLDLTVSSITASGTDAADFTLDSLTPASPITAGNSATFTVTFDPSATGTRTATITVNSNDSDEGAYDFAIQGTGLGPGALDPGFGGGDGKVTTAIGSTDFGYAVAVQSDGRVVVGGSANNGSNNDMALARYNDDGTLDTSFGGDGKVTIDFAGSGESIFGVAIQSDGKIVGAGGSSGDFALVRCDADGAPDTGFGTGGKVITDFGGGSESAWDLALQPDGRIVLAGYSNTGGDDDFALARYNSDGTLDTSFGTGGKVVTDFGGMDDRGYGVAIQANGKIVVVGDSRNGNDFDFVLARYNADGTLDAGFGSGGKVTTAIGGSDDRGRSVALQWDGKIVVAGMVNNGSDLDFALLRYNADGTLDTSLDGDGIVTTAVGSGSDQGYAVTVQANGKIVVGGAAQAPSNYFDFALARYNANGSLDTGFGVGGKVISDFVGNTDAGTSLALQADGTIVVAGYSTNGSDYDFALARYLGDPVAPEINLVGNSMTIADGDTAPDPGDHTDFGSANVGGGTVTRTFTVQNTGTGDLRLYAPTVTLSGANAADFSVTAYPYTSVAAGGSTTFQVTFAPSAAGTRTATVTIVNDDSDESTYDFAIQGAGTVPPPQVTGRDPGPGATIASASVNIDVTFSVSVVDVDATDLVPSGTAAGTASVGAPTDQGGATWRFPISGLQEGSLALELAPDSGDIVNGDGVDLAPTSWSYTVDFSYVYSSPGGSASELTVRLNGGTIEIVDTGTGVVQDSRPLAGATDVVITGSDGEDDTLTVDLMGFTLPVTFHGGSGGNDSLELTGGSFTTATYTATGPGEGTIDYDGQLVTYTGLEPITDSADAVNRVFTIDIAGAHQIRLTDDGVADDDFTTIDSNGTSGFEQVTFASPTATLTINAGDGDDTIFVVSVDSAFPAGTTILLDGQAGDDTVAGPDAITEWHLTAGDAGTVDPVTIASQIDFASVESLSGGPGIDMFHFNTPGVQLSGSVDGNAGTDYLDYAGYGATDVAVTGSDADGQNGTEPNSLGAGFRGIDVFGTGVVSVPALGEWGVIALVVLLALAACRRVGARGPGRSPHASMRYGPGAA